MREHPDPSPDPAGSPHEYDPDLLDMSEPPITEGEWLESLRPLEPEDDPDYEPSPADEGDQDARFWELVTGELPDLFGLVPAPVEPLSYRSAVWVPVPGSRWFGMHPDVTLGHVLDTLMAAFYGPFQPERLTHDQMVQLATEVWDNEWVCDLFLNRLAETAEQVCGQVQPDYPTPIAVHIIRSFSELWNGCPYQDDHDQP